MSEYRRSHLLLFESLERFSRTAHPLKQRQQLHLALGLRLLQGYGVQRWRLLMAAALLVMLPVLALSFLVERYMI